MSGTALSIGQWQERYLPPSDKINARLLAVAGTAESETVPAGYTRVIFSSTENFWANANGTAVKPAADISDGTASDLNPSGYSVVPGTVISLVADVANTIVHCRYYKGRP